MICDKCVWSKIDKKLNYCKKFRKNNPDAGFCDKFYAFDWNDDKEDLSTEERCFQCKRIKDKGKPCWWCNTI